MKESEYTLTKTGDPARWEILRSGSDDPVFTFTVRDESFAQETLANLNAGTAWEPALEGGTASQSLGDSDALASAA